MKQELSFLLVLCASVVVTSFDPNGRDYYRQVPDIEEREKYDIRFVKYKETAKKYNIKSKRATPSNITTIQDHHLYYTSEYIPPGVRADSLWFELADLVGSGDSSNPNVSESPLQNLHLTYQVWNLKFEFPFYGHKINRVGVATGGFLYTGTFFHDRVHLTQFIAPLQANFNPSLNDTAKVLVYTTDTRFTVQWDEVHNHDHVEEGPFSFQVSLFRNGTIHFVYREIPLSVNEISNDNHPVEVGLADAFYIDIRAGFFILRYVYEYSRIQLNSTQRLENSAYIITPVKNCVIGTSCETCAAITDESLFDCKWCPNISRCSDGIDRHRQEWFVSGCNNDALETCGTPISSSPVHSVTPIPTIILSPATSSSNTLSTPVVAGIIIFIGILIILIIAMIMMIAVFLYSYKKPQSRLGLFMIEHRPKARSLNRTVKYEVHGEKTILY